MYHSNLMIDVGDNPDRPRPGRLWLRNIYHVHQRLSMAFPMSTTQKVDPNFLLPFDPNGFDRSRFLFRIDQIVRDNYQQTIIIVQSETEPDWKYAFHNLDMVLAAPIKPYEYTPAFQNGDIRRFRIRVNPTKKSATYGSNGADRNPSSKSQGKRVTLWDKETKPTDAILDWFARKGSQKGFSVGSCDVVNLGWVVGKKPNGKGDEHVMRFRSALLEGKLTVTDAMEFHAAINAGIGSAKGFGFGLLSVFPIGDHQ